MALLREFCVLFVLVHFSAGRAVNISNTWVLPEEGFPVFYRYFRDRVSWYEADAVCQFHHSYLVTADTTSQYDAIRAYLKELDITDNVWIGLSKNTDKPNFIWTNSLQALSGEGHWQEPIPQSKNPLCVAMDPAKDFLWKSFTCGGPEVASFICETPIPSWALGPKGCLLTELPSLTVLYIPEQSSLELTSDCGLDGTKRIACKGNADREEILKQLTCVISNEDFEDKATKSAISLPTVSSAQSDGKTTKTAIWTSNTIEVDYGMPTRHRRETEDTLSASSTESTGKVTSTLETFTGTTYDTEVTTSKVTAFSTVEPIVFNISSPEYLEIIQESPKITSAVPPSTTARSIHITSEKSTTILDTTDASTTISYSSTNFPSSTVQSLTTSTTNTADKDIAIEYPSAISQGQLFSIIENGTMFDIIELNETTEQKFLQEVSNTEEKPKLKPSTKLAQLDDKNNKMNVDVKSKPQTKKDIYKNADPKKKNLQKNNEDKFNKQEKKDLLAKEGLQDNSYSEKTAKLIGTDDNKTVAVIEKREDRLELTKIEPEDKTEIKMNDEMTVKENTKEETDLNSQIEVFSIKQIEQDNIEQQETEDIEKSILINKEVETFPIKQIQEGNKTHTKIDDDIDKKEEQIENERREEMEDLELNKEIELFPIINDKSLYLNRTFRKELPMIADDPTTQAKDVDENKLELFDEEETVPKNDSKIDPNIDQLNKNITTNNDSEIIGKIDKDVLKKQLLPKPLQGETTTKPETSTQTQTTEKEDIGDHQKPNRQRQLTRPHGRPFYPNFFSRVLG